MGEKADMKAFIEGKADSELSFIPRPNLIGFHFSLANQEADDKRWICWNHEVNVVLVDAFEQCITVDTSFLNSDLVRLTFLYAKCSIQFFGKNFHYCPKTYKEFNAMINDCGIIDCGRKPGRISKSGGFVWARLDRVFTNPALLNLNWRCWAEEELVVEKEKKYTTLRYKEGVLALLDEFRNEHRGVEDNRVVADPKELRKLQMSIENLTMHFDEELYAGGADSSCSLWAIFEADANSMIRVATLVEQLEGNTRSQAKIIRQHKKKTQTKIVEESQDLGKKTRLTKKYPLGTGLVEFMEQRGLISLANDSGGSTRAMKKGESYYLPKTLFVVCNFDISLLPIKLNLPMVYPPLEWKSAKKANTGSLSDLTGGYLSSPTNSGLLVPRFVAELNVMELSSKLRELYMKDKFMQDNFTYNELLGILQKDIQRARYEKIILELGIAYEGYTFYLPAFLDFRGRIYRSGVLHFHERDYARSLLQFADSKEVNTEVAIAAACFQFQSFKSDKEAFSWCKKKQIELWHEKCVSPNNYDLSDSKSAQILIQEAKQAKHPFQFLSSFIPLYYSNIESVKRTPITQDASASAFQIMSYFLLDEWMARKTNLIQSSNGEIEDIYLSILSELQSYILKKVEDRTLSSALVQVLNRKIVKSIFMPIIYGKTVMTTALDIRENLSRFLTTKECFVVAKLCFEFWRERFHNMECLIRLIRSIGWLTSSSGRPVRYEVENFQTIQDYMKMDAINIWVYEKLHKKRRQVTLRVASDKRDSRKTEISSFVNFIHQKDAHIAMKVVERMLSYNAPIYTVHDNFISTSYHSKKLASIYSSALVSLGHPLKIINKFIYLNVIKHQFENAILEKISDSLIEEVIPRDRLTSYLKENIPEDIRTSNSKRKIWDERIETILNSYESYTQLVCGPYERAEEGRVLHHKKYENFLGMMKKKSELPLYCYSIRTRAYSTYRPILDNRSFDMFFGSIESTRVQDPHKWLITASHSFRDPKPSINHVDILALCIMDLLHQFAYPSIKGYAKFGILLTTLQSYGEEITFSIGTATPLTDDGGNLLPKAWVYSQLYKRLLKASEDYDGNEIVKVTIRVYLEEDKKPKRPSLSEEERQNLLRSVLEEVSNKTEEGLTESNAITARKLRPSRHPTYITSLKKSNTQRRPFMVSDLETLLDKNNYHQPYAAGLLMVIPGKNIKDMPIKTYFSEDYSILYPNDFEKRSEKVLFDLVLRISAQCKIHKSVKTIYFHNFSRFDGIILLKHLACKHTKYTLKPLIRNNRLYELAVYSGKKMLFRFRDSYNLLPSSLSELAKSLCPDLGGKGSVDHKSVKIENIGKNKDALLDYMRQDVYLLGGVMLKAQDIYWNLYKVDIESKITLSSLALNIFRLIYYDDSLFPIHIPTKNEDKFIRHAYYGGHTDVYKPFGEDLYYYDVNSLYPFVMKEYPMPAGHPVWYSRLDNRDLEGKLGFIEAYVVCPKTIKKPFLPYREKEGTLIFPTGEFVGVYYSEELKFAREIGYTVIPLSGYLFEKKESPFSEFVSAIFSSRLEAKKSGNDALSYVYKILMNSLYGRFGINPMGTITEVCDNERRPHLMRKTDLISTYELSDTKCIITYRSNTENDRWDPPKNSAVQLAAAITACARIYMYPYISREDCYYTYTDSVVLSMPLPEEMISSSIIGLFKLEDRIVKGYFLAPKSYYYSNEKGKDTLKYKGIANKEITPEWFISQYADPDRTKQVKVESNFQIEWSTFNIFSKEKKVNVGLNPNPKRLKVYEGGYWVDTKPVEVKDLSRLDFLSKKQVISLMNENLSLKNENLSLQEKLSLMERDKKKGMDERGNEMKEEPTEGTNPTIDEIPNTDKKKVKKANTFKVKKVKKANSDKKKKVKKVKKANTDKKKKKKPRTRAFSASPHPSSMNVIKKNFSTILDR
ncbi:hypothetical protein LXL04_040224 [Taraxacum kok-saghyz]